MEKTELLDWAETAGIENLRAHLVNVETLSREASTTLTLLLAGVAGALAYAVRIFDGSHAPLSVWGAAAVCVWLTGCAAVLVHSCLMTKPMQQLYNEPDNIYRPELNLTLDQAREFELQNIQARIRLAAARNKSTGRALNKVRLCAALTPLLFTVAVGVAAAL